MQWKIIHFAKVVNYVQLGVYEKPYGALFPILALKG